MGGSVSVTKAFKRSARVTMIVSHQAKSATAPHRQRIYDK
jgi:hypothetical protein